MDGKMNPKKMGGWITRWFDSTDPTRDAKLLAYIAATGFAIFWLTKEQARGPIKTEWVDSFKWFLASTSIGGAIWTGFEKWKGGGNAQAPTQPGAQDEGGQQ